MFEDWEASIARQAAALGPILERECGPANSVRILDCACGIGTQTLGLAKRGFRVTGADVSPRAIARARLNREVDYDEDWLGAPLFWSSFDADGERAALCSAGFEIALDSVETISTEVTSCEVHSDDDGAWSSRVRVDMHRYYGAPFLWRVPLAGSCV